MRWTFLGTGGGRWSSILQFRRTGGILIEHEGKYIILDPGPGSILNQRLIGFDPRKLNCVMISHNHTDHITDAPICIEGMTNGCYEKKGILVGPKTIYEDHENFKSLSNYHLNACKTKILAEPGKEIKLFDGLKVKVAPTEHNEPYGVGYIFETEDIQVSYLGDTAYFEGLEDLIRKYKPRVLMIDVIDDIISKGQRGTDGESRVGQGLKDLGRKYKHFTFYVHHISKSSAFDDKGIPKRLTIHSGKGSSTIEQKSDIVFGIEGFQQQKFRVVRTLKQRDNPPFQIGYDVNMDTFEFIRNKDRNELKVREKKSKLS